MIEMIKSLLVDETLMYRGTVIHNSLNGWTRPFISETWCQVRQTWTKCFIVWNLYRHIALGAQFSSLSMFANICKNLSALIYIPNFSGWNGWFWGSWIPVPGRRQFQVDILSRWVTRARSQGTNKGKTLRLTLSPFNSCRLYFRTRVIVSMLQQNVNTFKSKTKRGPLLLWLESCKCCLLHWHELPLNPRPPPH